MLFHHEKPQRLRERYNTKTRCIWILYIPLEYEVRARSWPTSSWQEVEGLHNLWQQQQQQLREPFDYYSTTSRYVGNMIL